MVFRAALFGLAVPVAFEPDAFVGVFEADVFEADVFEAGVFEPVDFGLALAPAAFLRAPNAAAPTAAATTAAPAAIAVFGLALALSFSLLAPFLIEALRLIFWLSFCFSPSDALACGMAEFGMLDIDRSTSSKLVA